MVSLRDHPEDQTTAHGRSRERYRRAAFTGVASALNRAVSLAISVITVPITYRYLGAERYGMWMTISSFILMLTFADLGMSNGLINMVADAVGRRDFSSARSFVASAFWMLCGVAAVLAAAMACGYPFINMARLFNVHSPQALREAGPALLALFLCFILNLPLGTVRGTQSGLQKGYVNNLWNILGALLALAALLAAIRLHAGLPLLVLALSGPPVIASFFNGVELFGWSHPDLRPTPRAIHREATVRLFHTGMMFFLLQLSISIGMQIDNIVIAQILGASSVAAYAVPARLFNMINALMVLVSGSVWPAYADALARADGLWIRKTFRRVSIAGISVAVVLSILFVAFGNRILALWIGPQMHASFLLLAMLGGFCVLSGYLQPVNFLLNGVGEFRVQVICAVVMALLNIALSIFFVERYGIVGAILGTVIAQFVVQAVPLTIVARRVLRGLKQAPGETIGHET